MLFWCRKMRPLDFVSSKSLTFIILTDNLQNLFSAIVNYFHFTFSKNYCAINSYLELHNTFSLFLHNRKLAITSFKKIDDEKIILYHWFNSIFKSFHKKKIVFGDENWFCKTEPKMFEIAFFTSEVVETLLDKEQVEPNKH